MPVTPLNALAARASRQHILCTKSAVRRRPPCPITLIPVSAEWAKRAYVDEAKYRDLYKASIADPVAFWREQGKRLDWIKPYSKIKDVSYDAKNLHIRWYEDGIAQCQRQLHRSPSGEARRSDRDHLGGRRSQRFQAHHLSPAARRGLPLRQRAEGAGRQEGRPRHDLHADDPGDGLRDARLHADRRGSFGRLRRLFAGQPRRAHPRLQVGLRRHRRRRACAAARTSR